MNDTATFYDEHWSIEGAYDGPEAEAFQLKLFREMFPGFEEKVPKQVKSNAIVLDVGCGNGLAARTYFGDTLRRVKYWAIDVSDVALEQCIGRMVNIAVTATTVQANYLDGLRFPVEYADVIFCPGVLHYAPDMRQAVKALTPFLKLGGRLVTWVYRRPPPIRILTDAFITRALAELPPDDRKQCLMELTELGIALGRTKATLDLTKGVRLLHMPPGRRSVQEFFYYFIMKLFYNPSLTLDRHYVNNLNAFGHEHVLHLPESEILAIFVELGYDLELWNPRGNGVAIVAVRTGLSEQEAASSC